MTSKTLLLLSALSALAASYVYSQSAETDPVGYVTVPLVAGADNFVAVPLNKAPALVSSVSSTSVPSADRLTINLAGVSSLTANQFADTHYVRFTSGAETVNGKYFTVVSNTNNSITIDTIGDDLSAVVEGNNLAVIGYWTLASLFPPASQTSLVVSTGNLGFQRRTEILLPDVTGNGINRAPTKKFYLVSSEWRDSADFSNADNTVILPDSFMIIRQHSSAPASNVVVSGSVPMFDLASFISQTTQQQDNYLSHGRPTDLSLTDLGLGAAFTDSLGNLGFQRRDELLVWENPAGINPAPDKKFYRVAGEWRDSDDFSSSNDYIVPANSPIIIRKYGSASESTVVWKNSPTY